MPLRKSVSVVIPIARFRYLDPGKAQWQHGLIHSLITQSLLRRVICIECSQSFTELGNACMRQTLECGIFSSPKHTYTCTYNPDAIILATYVQRKTSSPFAHVAEMQGVINILCMSESCYLSAFLGLLTSLRVEADNAATNAKLLDILTVPCQSLVCSDPKV